MKITNYAIKSVFFLTLTLLFNSTLWAQVPDKMSYQAVVRDSDGALVTDTQVGMHISILQGSENGTVVYSETQSPTTNANGLVSIQIGGADLASVDWANGPYFIKTETDPTGGTNYSISGASQLLSVPYAMRSNETDPSVPQGTLAGDIQFWNGSAWKILPIGSEGDVLTVVNGLPRWYPIGGAPEVPTVTSITGRIWMDRNLGASQVATSSTDVAAYGDLYQWGRGADGHEKRTSDQTDILSTTDTPGHGDFIIVDMVQPNDWRSPQNHNLWQGEDGINNPCPVGFRIPTEDEFLSEIATWTSADAEGAFNSPLKLPKAGLRSFDNGRFYGTGTGGDYWTSTITNPNDGSRHLGFSNSNARISGAFRADGFSIRCIKE